MKHMNKNALIVFINKNPVVSAIAAVTLVLLVLFGLQSWYYMVPADQGANSTGGKNTSGTPAGGSTNNVAKPSYVEALQIYQTKRIQFDSQCAAIPTKTTFKVGTTIMLDNRSNNTITVKLDTVAYTLKPYDYALAALTTNKQLPASVLIDCGSRQNVATITLQK